MPSQYSFLYLNKSTELTDRVYTVGRSNDCDIVVDHPTVSRYHCVIARKGSEYEIVDMFPDSNGLMRKLSKNGVKVNGVAIDLYTIKRTTKINLSSAVEVVISCEHTKKEVDPDATLT